MEQDKARLEFVKAFNKCQGLLSPVKTDSVNPHFKSNYASLEAVMGAVQPFVEAGFVFLQGGIDLGGKPYLRTKLIHSAGHEEVFDYPLIADANPQHLAAASTYARRYSICALVGLVVADDDGNTAAGLPTERKAYVPSDAPKRTTEPAPQTTGEVEYVNFIPTDVQMVPGKGRGEGKMFSEIYNGNSKYSGDEIQGQMAISALEAKKEISVGFVRNGKYLNIKRGCVKMSDGKMAATEQAAYADEVPF